MVRRSWQPKGVPSSELDEPLEVDDRPRGPGCLMIYGRDLRCDICDAPAANVSPDFSFNAIVGCITWECLDGHRNMTGRRGGQDVVGD